MTRRRPRREPWLVELARLVGTYAVLVGAVLVIAALWRGAEWMATTAWGANP